MNTKSSTAFMFLCLVFHHELLSRLAAVEKCICNGKEERSGTVAGETCSDREEEEMGMVVVGICSDRGEEEMVREVVGTYSDRAEEEMGMVVGERCQVL
ncbi:hypothetical protein [Acinetobacter indicus]|uniref:hypothetical protein n=1 Tax=Acinetobacter indicus TaxID=756892 RepID=UPI001443FD64